jgi:benzodiazapine receptor
MKSRQILNLVGLVLMLVVNILANALPINNITTGAVSDGIPSLFTPAGYVFSIWGVIYLALIGFGIYQALPKQKDNPRLERIGLWFFISSLFNSAWIFAWHYRQFALSVILMLGLLVSLLMTYLRAGIVKQSNMKNSNISRAARVAEYVFIDLPFGIYLGWISVATIANISSLLVVLGWGGFGLSAVTWTIIMLVVGALLGILMILLRHEVAYALVIIWAFMGIFVSRTDQPAIQNTALVTAALVTLVLLVSRLRMLARKS